MSISDLFISALAAFERKEMELPDWSQQPPATRFHLNHEQCSVANGHQRSRFSKQHIKTSHPHSQTHSCNVVLTNQLTLWPESASEVYRPSDRRLSAKSLPFFADRMCYVISTTDPLRPYSRIFRPEPLHFLSSNSSIVLTRLSGHRSSATTSQKIW
jgi:hypothetical protein